MLIVETIRKVRLSVFRDKKSIRETARDLNLSRNTVRKVIRTQKTAFQYQRSRQPRPKLVDYIDRLDVQLLQDSQLPKRERRTCLRLFQELQLQGYDGGYDSVRRYVQNWQRKQAQTAGKVFIPLTFKPGEAFQFDWSHEYLQMAGMPVKVKVAHFRLAYSRMFITLAYPRETLEMLFDAHIKAFEFFGGICRRGIYDNLKTVVNKILSGKERNFNNRFDQLSSYYLFEPVACTPASGWEILVISGIRKFLFSPRAAIKVIFFRPKSIIIVEG